MKIVFRVDASLVIGAGHVMRCLALASFLKDQGGDCWFICRCFSGNLISLIKSLGFQVTALPNVDLTDHFWRDDLIETKNIFSNLSQDESFDWLVVDQYHLDARWEAELRPFFKNILVIDDLANRPHDCDVLVDQNLGRSVADYSGLVFQSSLLLVGPQYALLRPEFSFWRDVSLSRKNNNSTLKNMIISLGGVDFHNVTSLVLNTLKAHCDFLPIEFKITVVMGAHSPHLASVLQIANLMPWETCVEVGVSHMAELMSCHDIAIGAAGGSAWERCCLGLPSLIIVLADNQVGGANALKQAGISDVIYSVDDIPELLPNLIKKISRTHDRLKLASSSSQLVDGLGGSRIVEIMCE